MKPISTIAFGCQTFRALAFGAIGPMATLDLGEEL
jgi:hypothetical protein